MYSASPLPATGEAFIDARGGQRALRVSWHAEEGVVVLSLWKGGTCAATFRLLVEDVPEMIQVLRAGLSDAYGAHRARPETYGTPGPRSEAYRAPRSRPEAYGARPEGYGARPEGYGARPEAYGARPEGYGARPEAYGRDRRTGGSDHLAG